MSEKYVKVPKEIINDWHTRLYRLIHEIGFMNYGIVADIARTLNDDLYDVEKKDEIDKLIPKVKNINE